VQSVLFLTKKKKIIAVILVIFLLIPNILISLPVVAAATGNEDGSWLKGILLIVISFIINNFTTQEPSTEKPDIIIEEDRLINTSDNRENRDKEVLGFYVNWLTPDASSYTSLKENWENIDMVSPFWYTVEPDGSLKTRYGGYQYEVDSVANNRDIQMLPLINNNQQNNMILVDPETRTRAVNNIVDLLDKHNFNGVNIDFEYLPPWTRNGYTSFIKELSEKLRNKDMLLTISVFPKIEVPLELQGAYDYAALGPLVDRIVIMTYDRHWSSGAAGPIAPIDWVERNIIYALEYIEADKILLGIANYGYDWPEKGIARDISIKEAYRIANKRNATIEWHSKFQSPYFYYWDDNGEKHEVWFENEKALPFKLDLVNKHNLRGIAIWRLGNENKEFWESIEDKFK